MFQLQVSDDNVTNGTIPVSWCLDVEILNELAKRQITDPQVVICVAPVDNYHPGREYRKVVPLKDLMSYIEFHASGKNKIWGVISFLPEKEVRTTYLEKKGGRYHTNILNFDGDNYSNWLLENETEEARVSNSFQKLSSPVSVMVPKEVFAPEPKQWEKTWVNHFFRNKVVDQCEFRRRRLFAYLVQPLLMLGDLLLKLIITTIGLLVLVRDFSFKYLIHPLTYSFKDTTEIFEGGSWVIPKLPEDHNDSMTFPTPSYFIKKFFLVPIMPLLSVPLIFFMLIGQYVAVLFILTAFFLVMFGLCIFGFAFNYSKIMGKLYSWANNKFGNPVNTDNLWYLQPSEINMITCVDERKPLDFRSLPESRKTIKLRFQNLKSKVCKPFSL